MEGGWHFSKAKRPAIHLRKNRGGGCLFCRDRSGSKVPIAESKSAPSIFHQRRSCRSSHTPSCNLSFSVLSFPRLLRLWSTGLKNYFFFPDSGKPQIPPITYMRSWLLTISPNHANLYIICLFILYSSLLQIFSPAQRGSSAI